MRLQGNFEFDHSWEWKGYQALEYRAELASKVCSLPSVVPALGPKPYAAQLQSAALLQFVDNLEKLMYNAYEGSAVGLQSPPKVK